MPTRQLDHGAKGCLLLVSSSWEHSMSCQSQSLLVLLPAIRRMLLLERSLFTVLLEWWTMCGWLMVLRKLHSRSNCLGSWVFAFKESVLKEFGSAGQPITLGSAHLAIEPNTKSLITMDVEGLKLQFCWIRLCHPPTSLATHTCRCLERQTSHYSLLGCQQQSKQW